MNKKISTIFAAGLLMVGALFSGANAQTKAVEVADLSKATGYYYVGAATNGYLKAVEKLNANDATKRTTLESVTTAAFTSLTDAEKNECLFSIVVASDGSAAGNKYLQLKSKAGKVIQFSTDQTDATKLVATSGDLIDGTEADKTLYTSLFTLPTGGKITTSGTTFTLYHGGSTASTQALTLTTGALTCSSSGTTLMLFSVDEDTKTATDLNKLNADRGSLSFGVKDITSSLFGKSFKAFEVAVGGITTGLPAGSSISAGTYFATSYPEELATKDVITTLEEFQACTFIAVDPNTSLGIATERKEGKYFGFKEVSGADFNFDGKSQDAEVAVQNAAFTVSTNLNKEDGEGNYEYAITANFRFQPETAKKDHAASGVCAITSDKINNVQSLTISKGASKVYIFKLVAGPIATPIKLLSKTGASIYNILFTSGKATEELGKYLGVGISSGTAFEFLAQGTAVANLNTPQYQFVISAVDSDENTITFTNRETKAAFTCTLDTTTTAGVYNIVSVTTTVNNVKAANLGTDGKYTYAALTNGLKGKTIQLIPATVDKFAGFSVRGENADQTFITFAKDANNAEKLYFKVKYTPAVGVTPASVVQEEATDKENEAALFELVKSEKPVYIRHNYMYDQNGVAVTKTAGDSVAYYTYYIKYINTATTAAPYYLKAADLTLATTTPTAAINGFIVKENTDGSVSIISASTGIVVGAKSISYDATSTKKAVINSVSPYTNTAAADQKLFLVTEKLGVTLDAETQHVAFESATGGFISLSAKNEGIVAIKTAADEDLTFWLDTADSKATLPAFYISKGVKATKAAAANRMFMYYAQDSANYVIAKPNPYKWSNDEVKVMFKAATLVSPDTLVTTANGKTINVAVAADVNGTQAGLNNFRFQIFKAADADDTYVIRNANGNYLVSINNQLTLGDKKDALKVLVATQDAPTSNEGTPSVSAVSVIASEGQITIAGADGKRVAISNILGQIIANQVITSSDATISVPAGIVVVAIEGEEAVKAIVK